MDKQRYNRKWFKDFRKKYSLTQKDLSVLLNTSIQNVYNWESLSSIKHRLPDNRYQSSLKKLEEKLKKERGL